jgi:hypothetical protein
MTEISLSKYENAINDTARSRELPNPIKTRKTTAGII